jgi:cellulose synthase/poly-beta-1,6-N-acetylglucosamine synthase-like glycosyltransferase
MFTYNVIQFIIICLLAVPAMYILLFALAGQFYREPILPQTERYRRMAVMIPGYKEDDVIVDVAKSALQQNYPLVAFDVIIIADSFQKETIEVLQTLPVKLIPVSFEKSTKANALNKAMEQLNNNYDVAVILDADNIMAADFLDKINAAFELGYQAVQGHRTAKNLNNSWAILDAASEEINNHIFRKGHRALGLSSAIIGSGMAFDYSYFKNLMSSVQAVGGFDKDIELRMLKQGISIGYLNSAYVYDEKVQETEVFANQRRRWLSAQLHYFRKGITDAVKQLLLKGNVDYFDKAIQFVMPPRVLLLGAALLFSFLFTSIEWLFYNKLSYIYEWLFLNSAIILALLLSTPRSFYNKKLLKSVFALPKGIIIMLKSLFKIKGANKSFIHTKHTAKNIHITS